MKLEDLQPHVALRGMFPNEVLTEQEGDFDAGSRWAVAWFERHGFPRESSVSPTLPYNGLVQRFPDLVRLAHDSGSASAGQTALFERRH